MEPSRVRTVNDGGYSLSKLTAGCSNLEWLEGYTPRFGLTVVDRQDNFRRYPKDSAFLLRTLFGHAISK